MATLTLIPSIRETRRVTQLLDRLDPTPSLCTVPGCIHGPAHKYLVDDPPTLAAA